MLGNLGDESAIESLIASLKEEDNLVRGKAAECLGKFNDERAVGPLSFVALNDKDSKVKKCAKFALLELNNPKAVDVYIKIFNTDSSGMRVKAAQILSNLDDPKAKNVKTKALKVIEEGAFLVEVIRYDKYSRAESCTLVNVYGEEIAKKLYKYGDYNPTLLDYIVTIDTSTNETIHSSSKWVCLDEEGNIIKKDGKPVVVKKFSAMQKSYSETKYDGSFINRKTRKIYPCKNCAKETGIENCWYVW